VADGGPGLLDQARAAGLEQAQDSGYPGRDHGVTLSASTVGRVLKRKGLYEKKRSDKRRKAAQRRAKRERAAREVWAFRGGHDLEQLNEITREWNETYNVYRPHQSLGYQTPMAFLKSWYDSSERRDHVSTM